MYSLLLPYLTTHFPCANFNDLRMCYMQNCLCRHIQIKNNCDISQQIPPFFSHPQMSTLTSLQMMSDEPNWRNVDINLAKSVRKGGRKRSFSTPFLFPNTPLYWVVTGTLTPPSEPPQVTDIITSKGSRSLGG